MREWGTRMVQSLKHLTLELSSDLDLGVVSSSSAENKRGGRGGRSSLSLQS